MLHDFLEDAAVRHPDKVALVVKGTRTTYGELDRQANAVAHTLQRLGVERGDRVLVFADNSRETVVSFWAALKANAVPSVINPLTKQDKLAYLLDDCRAKVLITEAHLSPVVDGGVAKAKHPRHTIVAGALDPARLPNVKNVLPWSAALDASTEPPRRHNLDIDLAAIIYTSGSTGEPKGVMLTHHNMLTATRSITTLLEMDGDDVVLAALPLAFNYGLYQMIMTFAVGGRVVLERGFAYPAQTLSVMAVEKVTGFPGVPTIFSVLAGMTDLAQFDLSSVRYITNTAAALTDKHIGVLRGAFPRARIYSMYGLTECKRCTYLPPEDLERKPTSVGIAIPNTELWIVDETGNKVGPNVVGQLVIRGATVMRGYWEKPEATALVLRPGPLPGEQVFYTGDLCRLDDEGYLYFVARMDDIIKTRAEKVAPKEVECAIMNIAGVREAAVIGVPDELLGQAIKAFVVLDQGAALTAKDIMKECQKQLESFMVPKHVELISELPKTTTGKITKSGLR
ncbi:MAG: class I adenylate-forming enzyme family protein [Myxococcota bacterium]